MRGITSNRCSRVIFEDRQNEGWVLRVRALMQVNEMGDDGKFSENDLMLEKLREETMNIWVEDMNERVEGKPNGDVSWRRVYRWRPSWRQEEELVSTRAEGLWVKARIGDWDCNLKEWKLGRGVHRCWQGLSQPKIFTHRQWPLLKPNKTYRPQSPKKRHYVYYIYI